MVAAAEAVHIVKNLSGFETAKPEKERSPLIVRLVYRGIPLIANSAYRRHATSARNGWTAEKQPPPSRSASFAGGA